MKTYYPRKVIKNWYLLDAQGKILGRAASKIASILRGKHKADFTMNIDTGDHVIVVNAEKILVTGKKMQMKEYFSHSGYPGGGKQQKLKVVLEKHPERVIRKAVKGMLPQNSLGRAMLRKLKVYSGPEHPHKAQNPVVING